MLRPSLATVLVAVLLEALPAAGFYTKKSPVLQIDASNYDQLIARSNHTSVLEFYAPWCGHCQNLKPAYEKAAKSLDGLAKVAAINCDEDSNKPFCGQMGVKGFPTLKLITPSKKPGKPRVEDYQGARTAKAIVEAAVDHIPNHIKRLTDKDVGDWLSQANDTAKAILFTEKGTTSALLRALAVEFLGSIKFAQIRSKEKSAVETFGISKFPTLVVLPGGEQQSLAYNGEMKKTQMMEFLSQVATPNPDPAPAKAKQSKGKKSSKTSKATESPDEGSTADDNESETNSRSQHTDSTEPETPPLNVLSTSADLKASCLSPKTKTCVLVIVPIPESVAEPPVGALESINGLGEIAHKHALRQAKLFPFYILPEIVDEVTPLKQKLGLSDGGINVIAINAKRGWWRKYEPSEEDGFSVANLETWIDSIRLGEGEKQKLPKGVIPDETETAEETSPGSDTEQEPIQAQEEPKEPVHEEL